MSAQNTDCLTLIPARMEATRLPGKPLREINGEPMIIHVWRRAVEADIGPVIVATDHQEIASAIEAVGGKACLTRSDHASGSDRIYEALLKSDEAGKYSKIINLQGDLPTLDPALVKQCAALLDEPAVDVSTLAVEIADEAEKTNPNVVKMVGSPLTPTHHRALYFTRATAPTGQGPLYHHIGIYGYQRDSLKRFIALPPSPLEQREKLEQLRALEAGLRIDVAIVNTHPLGVDTEADLEKARALLAE
ncbi:MAG: 3-deoxy-manno-octulosonate cytidylyltransferase [Rhodomicrobium sp.]|nr:MAG: 3-deoxy-manno-octulosonate cytidylyltransferase [Rhodomicrobium sp.]